MVDALSNEPGLLTISLMHSLENSLLISPNVSESWIYFLYPLRVKDVKPSLVPLHQCMLLKSSQWMCCPSFRKVYVKGVVIFARQAEQAAVKRFATFSSVAVNCEGRTIGIT